MLEGRWVGGKVSQLCPPPAAPGLDQSVVNRKHIGGGVWTRHPQLSAKMLPVKPLWGSASQPRALQDAECSKKAPNLTAGAQLGHAGAV